MSVFALHFVWVNHVKTLPACSSALGGGVCVTQAALCLSGKIQKQVVNVSAILQPKKGRQKQPFGQLEFLNVMQGKA